MDSPAKEQPADYFLEYTIHDDMADSHSLYRDLENFFKEQFGTLSGSKISSTLYWIKADKKRMEQLEDDFRHLISNYDARIEYFYIEVNLLSSGSNFFAVEGGKIHLY
ncbi:hypothetical protein [Breznakiella homolactica]|uniref:Uncharacterized protein n=1 Tax=Breznakiella homolactica TaxID=2798577 RepID=A0A7T8BA75_9SPIR|nr:hypothetical protein [Breznakiella homolactica]QQO07938.1 hypothetical protein JFL75_13430 [Breznakiella homolactica]